MVIIESGATKADWTFQFNDQSVVFRTEGMRPGTHSNEHILTILEAAKNNLPTAGSTPIFCYASGCLNPDRNQLMHSLLSRVFPKATIAVWSDLHAAARGLLGNTPGFCGILGTGSVAFQWDGEQVLNVVGGKGFPGGDTGGGADLGLTLFHFLQQNEKELPEVLIHDFTQEFGPIDAIAKNAQLAASQASYYAQFAPFIASHSGYPAMRELYLLRFSAFFEELRTEFTSHTPHEINLCGSIAHFFCPFIQEAASQYEITVNHVIKSPLNQLLAYHNESKDFVK